MKTLATLSVAFLAFVIVPCSRAQQLTPAEIREIAKENETKQEELINLEQDTARAMQWNNGALFRRIYGDDFVGILPSGQVKDKAGWIASIACVCLKTPRWSPVYGVRGAYMAISTSPNSIGSPMSTFTGNEAGR